jgi:hypothetical protein
MEPSCHLVLRPERPQAKLGDESAGRRAGANDGQCGRPQEPIERPLLGPDCVGKVERRREQRSDLGASKRQGSRQGMKRGERDENDVRAWPGGGGAVHPAASERAHWMAVCRTRLAFIRSRSGSITGTSIGSSERRQARKEGQGAKGVDVGR